MHDSMIKRRPENRTEHTLWWLGYNEQMGLDIVDYGVLYLATLGIARLQGWNFKQINEALSFGRNMRSMFNEVFSNLNG